MDSGEFRERAKEKIVSGGKFIRVAIFVCMQLLVITMIKND